jgi:hypothetical protein
MSVAVLHLPCYLAEWYQPDLSDELLDHTVARLNDCVATMCKEGSPIRLLMTLAVPNDELIFGVFAADSEQVVAVVCSRAGIPTQRLSLAIDAHVNHGETPDSAGPVRS